MSYKLNVECLCKTKKVGNKIGLFKKANSRGFKIRAIWENVLFNARLATLEQVKKLVEEKAARTKKIEELERELGTASINLSINNQSSENNYWTDKLKGKNKMNDTG